MKGIYVLVVSVKENVSIRVGALGDVRFVEGSYCYVGSAQSNLEKRIRRHLRRSKRSFWHIDYLLANHAAEVSRIFCKETAKLEECEVSRRLAERGTLVRGFGSSDCSCMGHLVRLDDHEFLRESMCEMAPAFFMGEI
jgi:Uri superfamily endonuclease